MQNPPSVIIYRIATKLPVLLLAACLVFIIVTTPAIACAETLVVKVTGFTGAAGNLHVMVWKDAAGFPTETEKAVARKVVPVTGPRVEVTFKGLARGDYAVAAFQDLNGNGKLDRSLLGWPTEPVGASNGATGIVGPPKFEEAAFALKQATQTIQLTLK